MTQTPTTTLFDLPGHRAVMTYNLKNGWNFDHWQRRRDGLAQVIASAQPLLLGTQEGFRFQLRDLLERLPGYDFVGDGRLPDLTDEHTAILYDTSRVTVTASGTFWLAETHDVPGSKVEGEELPRIATWAHCAIEGLDRELVFVNTHLTHVNIGLVEQTNGLIQGIERIADRTTDVILTGDFNQGRHSATWETVTAAGFVDAVDFADAVEGPIFTHAGWDQWTDERASSVTGENRIDWIMYRPGIDRPLPSNVALRVINTHNQPEPPSDHFPVVLSNHS